eukprot:COSAG01_NODE_2829_length_6998_cov_487.185824_4_plen_113_part_00
MSPLGVDSRPEITRSLSVCDGLADGVATVGTGAGGNGCGWVRVWVRVEIMRTISVSSYFDRSLDFPSHPCAHLSHHADAEALTRRLLRIVEIKNEAKAKEREVRRDRSCSEL